MRKKILLTMMLLTVCASGTNSIFATENVEKNEIEVYEISLKKFDYNKVCEWLLEKEPQECNIISQKNGSLIIESEESSVYVNEGTIEYKKDDIFLIPVNQGEKSGRMRVVLENNIHLV